MELDEIKEEEVEEVKEEEEEEDKEEVVLVVIEKGSSVSPHPSDSGALGTCREDKKAGKDEKGMQDERKEKRSREMLAREREDRAERSERSESFKREMWSVVKEGDGYLSRLTTSPWPGTTSPSPCY